MSREIKFSLVFRDMWQSAGKYVPRVDQLVKVAPAIIKMGCFARVETNGGGFEQVNLLYGENPNRASASKPFEGLVNELNELGAGIGVQIKCQREDIFDKMHRI